MSIVVNIYYTGTGGNARKFAEEMEAGGIAAKVRDRKSTRQNSRHTNASGMAWDGG